MVQVGDPINLADYSCCPSDGHMSLLPAKPHGSVDMGTTNLFNCCSSGIGIASEGPAQQPGLKPQPKQDMAFG